jgi:hypothetical protein
MKMKEWINSLMNRTVTGAEFWLGVFVVIVACSQSSWDQFLGTVAGISLGVMMWRNS